MADSYSQYSSGYEEMAFESWYLGGCKPISRFWNDLEPDTDGRKPTLTLFRAWVNEKGWYQRKDVLDAEAATKIDNKLVSLKVQMFDEQASRARAIQDKAFEHLMENGFDSSASAVQALIKGAQDERVSRGASTIVKRLAELGDERLMDEIKQLSERAMADIIDVTEDVEKPEKSE